MAVYEINPVGAEGQARYVKAATKAQAVAFVANQSFDAKLLRVGDIVALAIAGKKIEQVAAVEEPQDGDQ